MNLGVFFIVVVSIVALIGVIAVIFGNSFLIVLAVISLPTSIILLLCVTEVETSIEEKVIVEGTTTCLLAPLNGEVDEPSDTIEKYAVRGEDQTMFLLFSEDETQVMKIDNDYVYFDYTDSSPSVLIRKCNMTRRHYYSFVFYTDDIMQYTSYRLQIPENAILYELNNGEYAELAETNLEPR